MIQSSQNPQIAAFLRKNHVAVLATVHSDSSLPHAATVYYATDSHINIYFLTKEDTTKSKNLMSNPHAALVVTEPETQRTAQIRGVVNRVDDKDMMERAKPLMERFSKQTADSETMPITKLSAGDFVLYRLVPEAIRLGDYKYGVHNTLFDIAIPEAESLE